MKINIDLFLNVIGHQKDQRQDDIQHASIELQRKLLSVFCANG